MKIKREYLEKLERQFAIDYNIQESQWQESKNIVTPMVYNEHRRRYTNFDPMLRIVSYYERVLVTAEATFFDWAKERYKNIFSGWIFQCLRLKDINKELQKENQEIKDIHHYFLPLEGFPQANPQFPVKWLEKNDFEPYRVENPFPEAICFNKFHPDMLAVVAMDGDNIMGMAGASEDGEDIWQIGITVKDEYRGRGVAVTLVTLLKDELIKRGKVPFYGTAESHNLSNSVAIKSGFFPVWAEMITGPIHCGTKEVVTENLILRKFKDKECTLSQKEVSEEAYKKEEYYHWCIEDKVTSNIIGELLVEPTMEYDMQEYHLAFTWSDYGDEKCKKEALNAMIDYFKDNTGIRRLCYEENEQIKHLILR